MTRDDLGRLGMTRDDHRLLGMTGITRDEWNDWG